MMTTDRVEKIEDYVRLTCGSVVDEVELVPAANWDARLDRNHAPLGFMPAERRDGKLVLRFSAEALALRTGDLSDDDLDLLLSAIEIHINMHVAKAASDTPENIEATIDRVIYDVSPNANELIGKILMRELDATIIDDLEPPDDGEE